LAYSVEKWKDESGQIIGAYAKSVSAGEMKLAISDTLQLFNEILSAEYFAINARQLCDGGFVSIRKLSKQEASKIRN
jgi:hypothetical protein